MGEAAEEGGEGGDEGMAALLKWAAHMGMSDSPWPPPTPSVSPPVEPSSSSYCLGHTLLVSYFSEAGGRGLAASRDLAKGELILRVPRKALFTTDSAMADEKFASCVKRHRHRLSPTQTLTVCLLAEVEKGRRSRWYPYLVEDAIWVSEKAVAMAKSEWKDAVGLMQNLDLKPQLLTFRSWLWASATISSRTLHIPWDSAGCLCPVGDLFNYAAPDEDGSPEMSDSKPETTGLSIQLLEHSSQEGTVHNADQPDGFMQRLTDGGYEENMNSYCFYARKRYKKGEQVLLGYGTYTNLELLEHYGFVLKENPNDRAFIELKAEVCTSSSWPRDSLYIQHDGVPSFALLCALRSWATPMNLRRTVGHRIYSGSIVSVENEVLIMKWLAKHCTDILARLKTTIREDSMLSSTIDKMIDHPSCLGSTVVLPHMTELREFFEAHGLTLEVADYSGMPVKARRSLERWKLAIQWRSAYKKMLQGCVFYCENLICCLSSQHV